MKKGFTLIELMIVVAIIAIIAAIAIPNLLTSRISANETNASSGLRTLVSCQATWRQQDSDSNGRQDNWCYDVSCFYRMLRADGATLVEAIDISFAKADQTPAAQALFGAGVISVDETVVANGFPTAKAGYLFQKITSDATPAAYAAATNLINRGTTPATPVGNDFTWAISAAPAVYGTSGVRIFIVNQSGTIYAIDPAGNGTKWTIGTTGSSWPGADPSTVDRVGGAGTPFWTVVQ